MARRFLGIAVPTPGEDHGLLWDGYPVYPNYQTAADTSVDTTNFDKFFDSSHDNVQKCLDRIDELYCFLDGGRADEIYASPCAVDGGGAT